MGGYGLGAGEKWKGAQVMPPEVFLGDTLWRDTLCRIPDPVPGSISYENIQFGHLPAPGLKRKASSAAAHVYQQYNWHFFVVLVDSDLRD